MSENRRPVNLFDEDGQQDLFGAGQGTAPRQGNARAAQPPQRPRTLFDQDAPHTTGGSPRQPASLFDEPAPTPRQYTPKRQAPQQQAQAAQPQQAPPTRQAAVPPQQNAARQAPAQPGTATRQQPIRQAAPAQQAGHAPATGQGIAGQQAGHPTPAQPAAAQPTVNQRPSAPRPAAPRPAPSSTTTAARPAAPNAPQRPVQQSVQATTVIPTQPRQAPVADKAAANGATMAVPVQRSAPAQNGAAAQAAPNANAARPASAQPTPVAQKAGDSGQRLSQFNLPAAGARQQVYPVQGSAQGAPPAMDNQPTRIQAPVQGGRPAPQNQATRIQASILAQDSHNGGPGQDDLPLDLAEDSAASPTPGGNGGGGQSGGGGKGGRPNGGSGGNGGGKNGGKRKKRPGTAKYVLRNIAKAAFCLFCVGVMLAGMAAVWVSGYMVEATANDDITLDLSSLNQPSEIIYIDRDGNEQQYYQLVGDSYHYWTALDDISDYVIDALISTEDKKFWTHNGVSLTRTASAALNQVFGFNDKSYGASTIDQQLVKNLTNDKVVGDPDGDMTEGYLRKLREIFRAWGLNKNYSKELILEAYLNTMPLTGTLQGVGAGAKLYFDKAPADLALHEAAMIVGITNWPYKYNPYTSPDACKARRDDVLYFMYQDGKITESEFKDATSRPLGVLDNRGNVNEQEMTDWYLDALIEQVLDDLVRKEIVTTRAEASQYLYNGGLRIYACVDMDIQRAAEEVYLHAYEEGSPFPASEYNETEDGETVHPQSHMTIMDYEGRVLGIVGGTGEKEGSRVLNRAYTSTRQVGSTMKAIAPYALGLEYNLIYYSKLVKDEYAWYREGRDVGNGFDWPKNYGAGEAVTNAEIPIYRAIAQSTNTVAAKIGVQLGMDELFEFVTETLNIPFDENDKTPSSLTIGGQYRGMTGVELTAAYAIYGNGGVYYPPRFYDVIKDSKGNTIITADNYAIQAVSEETAYIMNRMLKNVMTMSGGTANGMGAANTESVGKTGTTSDDKDRWFVGLTPYYVSAVWWGYDDNQLTISHSAAASTNATTLAWRSVMDTIQAELPYAEFASSPGVVQQTFCTVTGLIAGEGCESTGTGYYKADVDIGTCNGHGAEPPPAE